MAQQPKAKVIIGADNSEFNRGVKQAQQELKSFEKVSGDVFDSLVSKLGLNGRKMQEVSQALAGMATKFADVSRAGNSSFQAIVSGAAAAGTALGSMGIAAAAGAFKLLTSEAEAFKNTVAGANIELMTEAYVSTYQQVMHDMTAATGESVAQAEANWKKTLGRFVGDVEAYFLSGAFGEDMNPWGNDFSRSQNYQSTRGEAAERAQKAAEYADKIFKLNRQIAASSVEWQKADAEIARLRADASDQTLSLSERQKAILSAETLIRQRYGEEAQLRGEVARLQGEMVILANSSVEETDKLYELQKASARVDEQRDTLLKSIHRSSNGIATAAAKEAEARKAAADALAKSRADLKALDLTGVSALTGKAEAGKTPTIAFQPVPVEGFDKVLQAAMGDTVISIGFDFDEKKLIDITSQIQGIIADTVSTVGEMMGSLIGDLLTLDDAKDAWSNFGNAALSAFGDMATSIGKIAIETGMASLGIQAAITALGPAGAAMAIGAGTALVALGAAVKTGLSNVASGNYSASAGIASSGMKTGSSSGLDTTEMNINVTGTIRASGSQLEVVLENERKRKSHTT